jgi:hypothetical protein
MKILHGQRHPWYIDGRAPHITWVLSVPKMLQVQTKEELDDFIVYRFGKIVYRFGQVSLILDYQYISYHFLWFLFNVMCHLLHFSHVFLHAPLDFWKLCHKNGPVRNATLFSTKKNINAVPVQEVEFSPFIAANSVTELNSWLASYRGRGQKKLNFKWYK